jgi:signal transduction histidine kinase
MLSLHSTERQVSIDFFGVGERLLYEYRLIGGGGGDNWSAPSDQRTVVYASLSSGRYRFEVRSIATDTGVPSPPATVAFTIAPPIWLRWWFITLSLATVALALYGLHRRRVAHLVEVERVRTRIATDLHDDLGANLSRVAILSEVVKQRVGESDAQSVSLLTEIADSSRSLMGSLRDLVWAIDPGGGAAVDVETRVRQIAGTLLDPKGMTWTLRCSDGHARLSFDAEQRRHVMLFFKEGINNAARYANASHVDLSIEPTRDAILCRIIDNGCGFDTAAALARDGRGLRNMHARANALGGRMDVLSRPGRGTTLTLTIPLARRALGA